MEAYEENTERLIANLEQFHFPTFLKSQDFFAFMQVVILVQYLCNLATDKHNYKTLKSENSMLSK